MSNLREISLLTQKPTGHSVKPEIDIYGDWTLFNPCLLLPSAISHAYFAIVRTDMMKKAYRH